MYFDDVINLIYLFKWRTLRNFTDDNNRKICQPLLFIIFKEGMMPNTMILNSLTVSCYYSDHQKGQKRVSFFLAFYSVLYGFFIRNKAKNKKVNSE